MTKCCKNFNIKFQVSRYVFKSGFIFLYSLDFVSHICSLSVHLILKNCSTLFCPKVSSHHNGQNSKGFDVPVHKAGSASDPNNYRGICIGSCMGKFFMLILNTRLNNFLAENERHTE